MKIEFLQIVEESRYLSQDEFSSHFDQEWDEMCFEFLKYESLQKYDEGADSPFHAFLAGETGEFISQLKRAREDDRPYFESARARGTAFFRLHAASRPFTKYLEFEYYSYVLSQQLGEQIYFIEKEIVISGDNFSIPDFVMFDRKVLLFHNYDENGMSQGGWLIKDEQTIENVAKQYHALLQDAVEFDRFYDADPHILKLLKE